MSRSNVPQFGNWENEDNVPYTVRFDKARKKKGGNMINPNDVLGTNNINPNVDPSYHSHRPNPTTRPEERVLGGSVRPTHEHIIERDMGYRQFSNPPVLNWNMNDQDVPSYGLHSPRHFQNGRPGSVAGSEKSFNPPPLHPEYQMRVPRETRYPTREGMNYGSNPVRTKPNPVFRGNNNLDGGTTVPKFGEWEKAENYTVAFDKMRAERDLDSSPAPTAARVPNAPKNTPHSSLMKPSKQPKCCFIL